MRYLFIILAGVSLALLVTPPHGGVYIFADALAGVSFMCCLLSLLDEYHEMD